MKKSIFTISLIAASSISASAALTAWQAAAAGIASNVTNDTNGGAGFTLAGTGIAYDYGDLSNGSTTTIGPGNAVEFIFNASDSGASIVLGGLNGWNNAEDYNFKLEQFSNKGIYGLTASGVTDADYTGVASTFNTDTHVVFVNRADNKMELYINGVSQGTSTRDGGWVTNGGTGTIGSAKANTAQDTLSGTVYGVASYNTAISSADVTTLYNAWVAPVPEPSSTALLGLGGLALILRRRK